MTVSLCLMVRNEVRMLTSCLVSIVPIANETIVVDTASTDRSKEIAAGLGAKIFDFPCCDDFAAGQRRAHSVVSKSVCAANSLRH